MQSTSAAGHTPTTYAPGYLRAGEVRLLNPYLGETFESLTEAQEWVKDEEHDKYMTITYFEVRPISLESDGE